MPSSTPKSLLFTLFLCLSLAEFVFAFGGNGPSKSLGDDHGLTDLQGREMLSAIFPAIGYLGHGLFVVRRRSPTNRFQCLPGVTIFNQRKNIVDLALPKDSSFVEILWFGKKDLYPNYIPDTLPDDVLIKFCMNSLFGVSDKQGNIIVPAEYTFIQTVGDYKSVFTKNGKLSIFDVRNRQLQDIDLIDDGKAYNMVFCDGLAPFRRGKEFGYVDTNGHVTIEPRFKGAAPFSKGMATVQIQEVDGKNVRAVTIDKTGKVISPKGFSMSDFYGDHAIAYSDANKTGLVDRNFKWVIEPEYTMLSPQTAPYYCSSDICTRQSKPALFYYAQKNLDEPLVVLSAKGEKLFELPNKMSKNRLPYIDKGALACRVWTTGNEYKLVYLDFKGKEIPEPLGSLTTKSVSYRQIAPNILMKTIEGSKEFYLQELERTRCPSGRHRR